MFFLKSSMYDRLYQFYHNTTQTEVVTTFPVFRPSLSYKVSMMITGGGNHKKVVTQRGSGLQEASGAGDAKVDCPGPVFLPKMHPTQAIRPSDPS